MSRLVQINEANGKIHRDKLKGSVAKKTAIVFLHPLLFWTQDNDWITVKNEINRAVGSIELKNIEEAFDDDPAELQKFARKVRRGQAKFRKNLLKVYDKKCCISETNVLDVLQAAHIYPHNKAGVNKIENGLLLRSDLHDLFDANMIAIDPNEMKIQIHPHLRNSEDYKKFHRKRLAERVDGSFPSFSYLNEHWKNKSW